MATKINTEYYGAESSFINESGTYITGNAKTSPYDIWDLVDNGNYTGGAFDYTAAPWGVGECSLSSDFSGKIMKTADNKIVTDYHFNTKGNSPLFLYSNSAAIPSMDFTGTDNTYANCTRALATSRLNPATDIQDDTKIISTLPVDTGNNYNCITGGALDAKPLTYLNYSKVRILPRYVWIVRTGQQSPAKYYTEWLLTNPDSSLDDGQIYQIVGFDIECFMQNGTVGQMVTNGQYTKFAPSVQSNPLAIPDILKSSYYGDNYNEWVRTHRTIMGVGTWSITTRYNSGNYSNIPYTNLAGIALNTEFDTQRDDAPMGNVYGGQFLQPFGQVSTKQQVFNDVSYHWEIVVGRAYSYSLPQNFDILEDGDTIPETGVFYPYAKLVIDDSIYETEREAYYYAIIHECAFMGFPVVGSQKCIACNIGDTTANGDVYLPVFDEHWITTGDFKTGSDSLDLVNSLWGDIFSLIMPEYDPTYDPNPQPDEGDTGDLSNTGAPRQPSLFNEITFYAMTGLEFYQFVKEVNAYYIGKTPDDWTLDFQGVNPAEYILGVYFTYFDLPIGDTPYSIDIGTITLPNVTAYKVSEGDTMLRPYRWQYCNFGTRTIKAKYGDFRDYPPYTTMELYLPLAGTIDIDSSYFIGHTMSITYYYNILTMTGVACVYRDNLLYKTVDLKIASQIPLLSTNIGQYQNQIAQLANAREQNTIRLTAGALSTAAGLGATIATGGAALPALIAAGTGLATMTTGAIKQDEISYQIEHTAPSLSVTGAAEANNALCCGQLMPKLIIKRAAMLPHDDTIYAQTVGNACCINDYIGGSEDSPRSGLVVCSNINTDDITNAYDESPTVDEINAIKQAFSTGVYV